MDLKPYIYDNGIAKRYYICSACRSRAMKSEGVDGCVTFYYICMECGSVESAPLWEMMHEPIVEDAPSEAWISMADLALLIVNQSENKN